MKTLLLVLIALSLTGCATNGQLDQKKTWLLIGGIVVSGAIVAHSSDSGKKDEPLPGICVNCGPR